MNAHEKEAQAVFEAEMQKPVGSDLSHSNSAGGAISRLQSSAPLPVVRITCISRFVRRTDSRNAAGVWCVIRT